MQSLRSAPPRPQAEPEPEDGVEVARVPSRGALRQDSRSLTLQDGDPPPSGPPCKAAEPTNMDSHEPVHRVLRKCTLKIQQQSLVQAFSDPVQGRA